MDKSIAIARQVQAQEQTAQGVAAIREQLDRIEAKLDQLLAQKPEKPAKPAASPARPEKHEAGA